MGDKYIFYDFNGKQYKIPESKSSEFEKDVPNAKINYTVDGKNYSIDVAIKNEFLYDTRGHDLSYTNFDKSSEKDTTLSFEPHEESHISSEESQPTVVSDDANLSRKEKRQSRREERANDDKVTLGETVKYSLGNIATSIGRNLWDWAVQDASRSVYVDPKTGVAERLKDYDSMIRDNDYAIQISKKLGEKADEFSRAADPTGGEKDYIDLLKEGKLGVMVQKSFGDAIQSAPATLTASNPLFAIPYVLGTAATNYAEQSINNPDIPEWKRGVYSLGSAVLEQVVERIENPFEGKAAKKLTEDAAKKLLSEGVEDGVKMVANRIFGVLKKVGKSAAGEGFEEGVTSFGNDTLGQALDWIDGNDDYGFTAQWKQLKEENPDANLMDFCVSKAREYLNASIGGAMAGTHMSGLNQAAREGAAAISRKDVSNRVDVAHSIGASMGYGNIYDVNEELKSVSEEVANAFVDEDGNQTMSNEFIDKLTAQDAVDLYNYAEITGEQRDALKKLAITKATQEGLKENLDNRTSNEINASRILIDSVTENGNVVIGEYNNAPVYVVGGVVNNGKVTLPNGNNGPVVIVDIKTGNKSSANSTDISSAVSENALEHGNKMAEVIMVNEQNIRETARNTMSPLAKLKNIQQYDNSKILINSGDALIEVTVQKITPEGQVLIKGKKGDLGGQSEVMMPAAQFYDSIARNEDGTPVFVEALPQREQSVEEPVAEPEAQTVEAEGPQDFREFADTIVINGVPVNVEVTEQDDTQDKITYTYVNENGQPKVGFATVADFANAVQQAEQLKAEAPKVEVPTESATPTVDETTTQTTTETPEVKIPDSDENINLEPESIDFDALFETDKEAFFNEIQNQFGEESVDILNEFINAAQQELDALNKAKAKGKNGILESRKAKLKLQEEIDALNGMVARLNPAPETAVETTEEVAAEPVEESVPEPVVEQVAESAGTPISEITELPEEPVVGRQKDAEPMNGVEFAARELGLKDGGIKLLWDSFKHHTGYGNAERSKFFGLFRTKEKGGMTLEEAGERLMELDRENQTGFFDQSDSNAGLNAILDAISSNNTIGELRSYAARMRQEEAQREADAAYSAMLYDFEQSAGQSMEEVAHYNAVMRSEIENGGALSDEDFSELNAIFAEEINDYETENSPRETDALYETEDIGDLPPSEEGTYGSSEGGNQVLQETQPVQTRGERDSEGPAVDGEINREDVGSQVYNGESGVDKGELVSSLDEDMPDFTGEEAKTPVAPNPVDNPVREAQKREKSLVTQLKRLGISHEAKQDMAYNAGKAVGDFFATRDEYSIYEENATDFGEFNEDFERGVNASFSASGRYTDENIESNGNHNREDDFSAKDIIRSKNESPVDFHSSCVDRFLLKYNPNTEIIVYPINENTAKMFGYTLEQLQKKHARYLPSYDFIALFAREDITHSDDIEEALFHESIHKLSNFPAYEYMRKAGKWMWEHSSDNKVFSYYREFIEENYSKQSEERKHDEMLAYVLGGAMVTGNIDTLFAVVPEESKSIFNDILKEIGYESAAEKNERRIRGVVPQPEMAETVSETSRDDAGQSGELGRARATSGPKNSTVENTVATDTVVNAANGADNLSSDNAILSRRADAQNAAIEYLAGDARFKAIENAVNEEAKKLGVKVTYKTREQMPDGHKADKGYYNTKTGEIVICAENASSVADAIQTILHESVAHKGLRQLMGDKFDEFISRVYNRLDAETKAKVDELAAKHYNGNTAVAMEEYMASLAEDGTFNSIWEKIKSIFNDILNKILGRNDIEIGDNELRYLLRASYNNMLNPRGMESLEGWAKDMMMREEYGINKLNTQTPTILSRTGIDPTRAANDIASRVYDSVVDNRWQEFQRQFQDAFQPVRIAIDAIQQETGNIPIEDYENYLLIQNQSSSRSRVEIDDFANNYYSPIVEQINTIIDKIMASRGFNKRERKNDEARASVYKEVRQYLIAKHGIERNKYYQEHKTRKLTEEEVKPLLDEAQKNKDYDINLINMDATLTDAERELKLREIEDQYNAIVTEIRNLQVPDMRDYSGLTALFNLDSKEYEEAERQAQELVDAFEKNLGRLDDDATGEMVSQSEYIETLWRRINSATNKTLRHSYESGLLSRQQYEEIKGMFEFYIPLRGFDETTAEDIYSYSRFEGNKFNPAVQKTGGRTSLADDPIAIIMNMAESEIAQGNKNRAKLALYNYILNRASDNNKQNSLMQIEDVWYVKSVDSNGNEVVQIASPDYESGETYEAFENRMQAKAENGEAYKSNKGKLDVGVRFQKQSNKGSHYVYLKVNGVEKAIYINGNPKAADAINGMYAAKIGEGMSKVKEVQRFLSSMFTNYSLEFTARNYFRDMVYSHINIGIRESDPAYRKKFRQNWRHNNMRSMLAMLKAYRAGEFEGRALTADEAAFVEFMKNGGQTGYTLINSVEAHKKDLERAIKRMQNGVRQGGVKDSAIFKYTLGGIELLNEASELVTRFAAYKTSRDMGRGVVRSISDAKEITVNFNTKGAQDGTGWMGILARYLGAVKYFFNASVQGVQNIGEMAQANKGKFGTVVGSTVALGALMPVLQSALLEILGGGDDEDEYWNIPEYDRQNNLCFVIGKGKYVKVPLPIGFREMYGIGDMIAGGIMDKKFTRDPMTVGIDVANKIATIALPINPLEGSANGLSLIESAQDMISPDAIQGIVQNRTNKDWRGAPIQKEYTYNEHDPQWTKAFANNPYWITGLSKWCYEHINIDGKPLDFSPEKLDNTLSNTFGGIYSLTKKTGKAVSMIWNEENRTASNIPLFGVVVGSGVDKDERFVNSAYWEMDEYYNDRISLIKTTAANFGLTLDDVFKRLGEGETPAGAHHPKMSKIYNRDNFDFMQEWYLAHKGEGDTDDNGNTILGISQIKNKIKSLETKIKKNEDGEPTVEQAEELVNLNNKYESARRELVNDLLELD